MVIWTKIGDRFSFGMIDFRNILGSSFEGTMSTLFYEPFLFQCVNYVSPKFKEINIWLWIVEDKRTEQVYKLVRKLQLEYAVSKSHYIATPAEGVYTTLKDKKTKVVNVLCLYFVYKAELLKVQNHPISQMDKLFQVLEGLDASKCLYDEAKYSDYHAYELWMELYLRMMRTLMRRGDCIFNVFGGSKLVYATMVSECLGRLTQTHPPL